MEPVSLFLPLYNTETLVKLNKTNTAAAAAKSLQSCPTLCDPIDGSLPGSPVPGVLQARTLEWVAISFSNAWTWTSNSEKRFLLKREARPVRRLGTKGRECPGQGCSFQMWSWRLCSNLQMPRSKDKQTKEQKTKLQQQQKDQVFSL